MSKQAQKKQEPPAQQQAPKEPIILPQIKPPQNFSPQSKNVGSATFSNIAKQAESLVSGDNSIVFNNYNNNAVFRSSRVDLNDCVSVDAVNKSIKNVNELTFSDKSSIKGICDGYVLNNQGLKVLINDKNIALSTAFSYRFAEQLEKLNTNLKKESSNRQQSHNELHAMIKELEHTEVHDMDIKINGSLTLQKSLAMDHFGIRNDGDLWTAFTMNDIDWMAFDNGSNKLYMYKPVEMNKPLNIGPLTINAYDHNDGTGNKYAVMKLNNQDYLSMNTANNTMIIYKYLSVNNGIVCKGLNVNGDTKINNTFNVGKLKITPSDSDNYSMFSLNDEHFMSFNANDDSTVLYKNVNVRGDLSITGNTTINNTLTTNGDITFKNNTTFTMEHTIADQWGPVADIGFLRICNGKRSNTAASNVAYIRHTSNNEKNLLVFKPDAVESQVNFKSTSFETNNYIKFTNDTVSNDYAYIQLKGTEANAGELEIATCDDATEPIYVRQYSGNRATLKRTLALLDGSGNTSIPGNLEVNGQLSANMKKLIYELIYPVGALYTSFDSTHPATKFGFGTWEQIVDRFLYCANSAGSTSGSKKIEVANLPSHNHTFTGTKSTGTFTTMHSQATEAWYSGVFSRSSASNAGFSNGSDNDHYKITWTYTPAGSISSTGSGTDYMPPYMTIYAWRRTN